MQSRGPDICSPIHYKILENARFKVLYTENLLVLKVGLEPTRPRAEVFETSVSADSTIRANKRIFLFLGSSIRGFVYYEQIPNHR